MRSTGLLEVAEQRVPHWRATRPHRLSATASWPTLPRRVRGRTVDVPVLPAVGTGWVDRGVRYWRQRVVVTVFQLAVATALGVLDVAFVRLAALRGSGTSWLLGVVLDQLPLVPIQERMAWQSVVNQLDALSPSASPVRPRARRGRG